MMMHRLQQQAKNPVFKPDWPNENEPAWRAKTLAKFDAWAAGNADTDYPDVQLVPGWHGTGFSVANSISTSGMGKLAKKDAELREKDRIEIYRPLIADPKEVRKQRAAEGKAMKKGGGKLTSNE